MALPRLPASVMLVVAAFSRYPEALDWARLRLVPLYGPITLSSIPYVFNQTDYYQPSMGPDLQKQFFAFAELVRPERLAEIKLTTNQLEQELAERQRWPQVRPLNLDPGILTLGKFHLATTKDQAHRVYLCDGIFAEVTLRFEAGAFVPWPWTYADYRQQEVLDFFGQVRNCYRERLQAK